MDKIISIPEGKLVDYIDGKLRNDTPEEYVRQTLEKRLVNEHGYKREDAKIEFTLRVGSGRPRADIVLFPKDCLTQEQENVSIIIECKKETIEPTSKKDGVGQLQSYMSACLNCEWGLWTNGKFKAVYRKVKGENGKLKFEEYNDIPSANGSLEEINRPRRETLKNASDDNLLFVFKICHNHIYINDGLQKQPAFFEFLKIIFCKIEDEKNIPNPLEFYSTSEERNNPDGQLTVANRISKIFERVKSKKQYKKIFEENDEIKLKPRSLAYIVSELQKYSLLNTHVDIKGKAYEELVGSNLRGDRGEFFTPRNVMHMTVDMLSPKADEKILDPSCGTGGFLVVAMNKIMDDLKTEITKQFQKPEKEWNISEYQVVKEKIEEIASSNFFGFDINPDLVKATKMNMVMNNDGSGNILQTDSLLPPHEWDDDFKTKLSLAFNISKNEIRNHKTLELFDVIVTNPPFGSKIPIKDENILSQFDLGHIWQKEDGEWKMTVRLQASVPPEQLFIERCLQFLKPGGRMGIVLPDSILSSPGLEYIRHWILQKTRLIASIDLHQDTFQPRNGTQTSVLFVQKKTEKELNIESKSGQIITYPIFMAMVDRVGHDKRGSTLFKRDKLGNEIIVTTVTNENGKEIEQSSRVIDDQTQEVPKFFRKWKREEGIPW